MCIVKARHLIISKIFIILHHPYCCYVYTLYNMFAHSCFYYYLLSLQYTVLHILFYCTIYLIFYYSYLKTIYLLSYLYLCIFSSVCVTYDCIVHGADLTYISLLFIFCIIVYVTNKNLESWITLNHFWSQFKWLDLNYCKTEKQQEHS